MKNPKINSWNVEHPCGPSNFWLSPKILIHISSISNLKKKVSSNMVLLDSDRFSKCQEAILGTTEMNQEGGIPAPSVVTAPDDSVNGWEIHFFYLEMVSNSCWTNDIADLTGTTTTEIKSIFLSPSSGWCPEEISRKEVLTTVTAMARGVWMKRLRLLVVMI